MDTISFDSRKLSDKICNQLRIKGVMKIKT